MSDAKYRRVADEIVDRIRRGDLKPGELIPSIRDLEREHGNSTAISAHRWLRDNKWVIATPGAGTRVAPTLPVDSPDAGERITALESEVARLQARIDALESSADPELRDRIGRMEAEIADIKAVGRSPRQSGTARRRTSG